MSNRPGGGFPLRGAALETWKRYHPGEEPPRKGAARAVGAAGKDGHPKEKVAPRRMTENPHVHKKRLLRESASTNERRAIALGYHWICEDPKCRVVGRFNDQ